MTLHTKLSYAKSILRIIGFACLGLLHFGLATFLLIFAELIGIAEELPGAYKGTRT